MATGQKLMRAIRVFEFGGPEVLKLQSDVAVPIPKDHQVEIITYKQAIIILSVCLYAWMINYVAPYT